MIQSPNKIRLLPGRRVYRIRKAEDAIVEYEIDFQRMNDADITAVAATGNDVTVDSTDFDTPDPTATPTGGSTKVTIVLSGGTSGTPAYVDIAASSGYSDNNNYPVRTIAVRIAVEIDEPTNFNAPTAATYPV